MSDYQDRPDLGLRRHTLRLTADETTLRHAAGRPWRVLLVSSELAWIDRAAGLLAAAGIHCICAGTLQIARQRSTAWFDAAVVDFALADGPGLDLTEQLARLDTPVVMAAFDATFEHAAAAAGAGACDLIGRDIGGRQLIERVLGAVTRPTRADGRAHRLGRMNGLSGSRPAADSHDRRQRPEFFDDQLPAGIPGHSAGASAAREHPEQMAQVTIANEFGGLIRHELDIESLLRTTLEFVLAKCGPTNAAVFLPTTSGDFSLGAYVNYDCPKETVDVLLDHLANAVAPRFQDQPGIAHLTDPRSLRAAIGDDAGWLEESAVVAFACRHDDEALAICMLFRDTRSPYPAPLLEQLRTVGELFAAQLARVIRIHHRHLPKDQWGAIGDTDDGDETDGYGGGGLAA